MKSIITTIGATVCSGILVFSSLALAAEQAGQGDQKNQKLKPYTLKTCLVSGEKLDGSMGKPFLYKYKEREIKFCCKSCQKDFDKEPVKYIKKLEAAEKAAKDAQPSAPAHDHSGHQS